MAWRKHRATSTLCSSWRNKSLAPRLLLECRGCVDHFDTRALGPTSSCPKQLKTRHITNLSVQPDGGIQREICKDCAAYHFPVGTRRFSSSLQFRRTLICVGAA